MEVVAVMVVMGIIAGVAVVSLGATVGNRPAMAAKQLQRDLTFARQRAVATGTKSWVVFAAVLGEDSWQVLAEDPDNPGRGNASSLTDPATGEGFTQMLESGRFVGVALSSVNFDGGVEIGFDWQGQPLNDSEAALAAQGSVVLTGNHTVTVETATGHVAYVAP
jgi:Tfp pilus assembly protein FimT